MGQCHRVKETTLNTSILYPDLFLLCVIDIPVAVFRSLWEKKQKSDIIVAALKPVVKFTSSLHGNIAGTKKSLG